MAERTVITFTLFFGLLVAWSWWDSRRRRRRFEEELRGHEDPARRL